MARARRKSEIRYDGGLCAGHLLVWTWRKFVAGHADCPVLIREYERFAGAGAEELLVAFAAFLQALGHGSRRVLTVGHQHCAGLTPDETHILRLIAAAQADDSALMTAHLNWLVRSEHQAAAAAAGRHLAERLQDCGVRLPEATQPPPPGLSRLEVVRAQA